MNENRERLRPIVDSIIFLARQNIPLRGHRDDGSLLDDTSNALVNEGNFRELLRFRIQAGDTILQKHLQNSNASATYISKTVQNELIDCCGQEILRSILDCVGESKFLFDETTDISHTSQMSMSLRYVNKGGVVREGFVQFLDVHRQHQSTSESSHVNQSIFITLKAASIKTHK